MYTFIQNIIIALLLMDDNKTVYSYFHSMPFILSTYFPPHLFLLGFPAAINLFATCFSCYVECRLHSCQSLRRLYLSLCSVMLFLVLLMYCCTHIMMLHRQGLEEFCCNGTEDKVQHLVLL